MDEHGATKKLQPWAWSVLIGALSFVGDMALHRMGMHERGWREDAAVALLAMVAVLIAAGVRSLWHQCEHDHHSMDAHRQ